MSAEPEYKAERPAPAPPPRFDEDDEWDANGWERVPTWELRPRA